MLFMEMPCEIFEDARPQSAPLHPCKSVRVEQDILWKRLEPFNKLLPYILRVAQDMGKRAIAVGAVYPLVNDWHLRLWWMIEGSFVALCRCYEANLPTPPGNQVGNCVFHCPITSYAGHLHALKPNLGEQSFPLFPFLLNLF
jgi:hypothetical protein